MSAVICFRMRISNDVFWCCIRSLGWQRLGVQRAPCALCSISFFLFLASTHVLSCPFWSSICFPLFFFKLKTFKERRVDWLQVKGDYWFNFLQDQTSCSLWCSFTTCMHNISCILLFFSHTSDFIWLFCFCLDLFYFLPFFHFFEYFCFFVTSFGFPFSSLISPSLPSLHHRSGCSCGTRRARSAFVASSPATSGTLLLQS